MSDLNAYKQKIDSIKSSIDNANKELIIAETNLNNLLEKKSQLEQECEQYAGTDINNIEALLKSKIEELDNIMTKLGDIDMLGIQDVSTITDYQVQELENLANSLHMES